MERKTHIPIAIIGGGPVGMMLALHLDMLGVPSALLERQAHPRFYPKGSTQNARTMEHYRRLGLAGKLRKLGLPPDHPTDVGYFTTWNSHELARIPMPSENGKRQEVSEAGQFGQVVEPMLRCNQMYVEHAVFEHVRSRPLIDAMFGHECIDWTDTGSDVVLKVKSIHGTHELTCDYMVACDGGQSSARKKLGIAFKGGSMEAQAYFGNTMISAHIRSADLMRHIPHSRCWQYWTINPAIRSNMVALNGRDEFVFMTQAAEGLQDDATFIRKQVLASLGEDVDLEILNIGRWAPGQALVAERYGLGRILLCGDAVHLFTPTGGFGMNTGVDDAVNLAWKLAGAVQGWGGRKLLASYELERQPIGLRNTSAAKELTRRVGKVPVSNELTETSKAGADARASLGPVLRGYASEFSSLGVQLGARYDTSPVIASDGTTPPDDDPVLYVPSACPGGRAPHFWISDGVSLYDRLGRGFTVLCIGVDADSARPLQDAASSRGIPLETLAIPKKALALYERRFALIRPDQFVAWRADSMPRDPGALLDQVTGN